MSANRGNSPKTSYLKEFPCKTAQRLCRLHTHEVIPAHRLRSRPKRRTGCRLCQKGWDRAYNAKEKARVKRRLRQALPLYRLHTYSLKSRSRLLRSAEKFLDSSLDSPKQ